MKERVMEIVFYIVDAMQSNVNETVLGRFEKLSEKLLEQGYTENEIDRAISWLTEKIPESEGHIEPPPPPQSDRPWFNFEKQNLAPAAYDFLLPLKELDLVGDTEIEQILSHAFTKGKKGVSIPEIKAVVDNLIFSQDDVARGSFFIIQDTHHTH